MIWAFWEIAKSLFVSVIGSRIGQLAIVALVSWFWASHNTNEKWKAIIAQEKAQLEAMYKAEIQRQKDATREVEDLASKRESENAEAVADMKATIEEYMKKVQEQSHVKPETKTVVNPDCSIDHGFSSTVRRLDATGIRKADPSARARKFR